MITCLRTYDRMTNCCLLFSLQAGVVIIGTLGIVWLTTSLVRNIFIENTSPPDYKFIEFLIAFLVIALMLFGHTLTLLAGSWAHINLLLLAFLFNTLMLLGWLALSCLSYINDVNIRLYVCIEGRCPDVLYLYDTRWRDLGEQCPPGGEDPASLLATRPKFSIAPLIGLARSPPDYVHQPGLLAPCYENLPGGDDYFPFDLNASTEAPCPRGEWPHKSVKKKRSDDYNLTKFINEDNILTYQEYEYTYTNDTLSSFNEDAMNKNLTDQTEFAELLYKGCEIDKASLIVESLGFCIFFSCFLMYGRAIEFNYYHELIIPYTIEEE